MNPRSKTPILALLFLACAVAPASAEVFAVVTSIDFPRLQLPGMEGPNYTQIQVFGEDSPVYYLYVHLSDGSCRWQTGERGQWRMTPFGIWLPDGLTVSSVDVYDADVNLIYKSK